MCGIAGLIYHDKSRHADETILTSMRDLMTHRGPDDAGIFKDGPLGLAHRRLSIIDVGHGHQPMSTDDRRYTVVFNGEIYNFMDIRKNLENDGIRFKTSSDTEVILNLVAAKGKHAVKELNGIFSFAIWDSFEKELILARDRMGIKPLYYSNNSKGFCFSSEIKSIFESKLVEKAINFDAIPEYFIFRQIAGEDNLFRDIKTLLPGSILTLKENSIEIEQYWNPSLQESNLSHTTFSESVDTLENLLTQAVQRQMVSDVPLGTFCSGGIDSSLITAIAANSSTSRINTFSVGFEEKQYDETKYARMVADKYNTIHHELILNSKDYIELLPQLIWKSDLPLNFTNSVHIYALSKLAKEHVTVVLTGEGADELFGGYPRYYIPRMIATTEFAPAPLRKLFAKLLSVLPDHRLHKLGYFLRQNLNDAILYNPSNSDRNLLKKLYTSDWPDTYKYRQKIITETANLNLDPVTRVSVLDQMTYMISILNRQDKMSMAASVEARVPFLDNNLVDFSHSLPLSYKQTSRHRKRVLKALARKYLPAQTIDRPKSGFGVPISEWMMADGALNKYVEILPNDPRITELIDRSHLQETIKMHREKKQDNSDFLWSAINLLLWRNEYNV